jgi:diaminohydroxyphosphoribosylaminopyrimidine deaminase / 5-amino-6-(5-phosphoribosylamino)uracil reductase
VNTVLADNPSLTLREAKIAGKGITQQKHLRRIILDSDARTPLDARVVSDSFAALTTVVTSRRAPPKRVEALARRVQVLIAPLAGSQIKGQLPKIDLRWLLKKLGRENVTNLLVEGGGEVNASFLFGGLTQRIVFFYAPKILGGRDSRKAVAGEGACNLDEALKLEGVNWKRVGPDLLLTARVAPKL